MPRLYSKRVGKHMIDNRVRKKTEERDAIIWTIDATNDIVYLKIQGSDTLCRAYYHQVIHTFPGYLKAGAAATIRFRRGTKGIVDVIGTGRCIPTPVGEGSALPPIELADQILSGMEVTATDPYSMSVIVASGTYRINNTLYVFAGTANYYYTMHSPAPLLMGTDNVTMGGQFFTVTLDPAPSQPYGRLDILVIGTDQVIDVIKGTEVNLSTTEPVMPTIPANHVLVGWILVKYGDVYVTSSMINAAYSDPAAADVHITLTGGWITTYYWDGIDPDDPFHYVLEWNPVFPPTEQPSCGITITVTDQYGSTMNFGGSRGRLTKVSGLGQVYGSYTGWRTDYAESSVGTSASFRYEREQPMDGDDPMDYSPGLQFEVEGFGGAVPIPLQGAGGVLL